MSDQAGFHASEITSASPKCDGPATLLQVRDDTEEIPDLGDPMEKKRALVKVEEFRCQELSCEHEF